MEKPLSDEEAYEALDRALLTLGRAEGETVHADTSLAAARQALSTLQMGLLKAMHAAKSRGGS